MPARYTERQATDRGAVARYYQDRAIDLSGLLPSFSHEVGGLPLVTRCEAKFNYLPTQQRNMEPRKLSLSRKGFDSKYGGCPSPIFPDGTMYSLPIPGDDYEEPICYRNLRHGDINIGEVVRDLTKGRHDEWSLAGLDPGHSSGSGSPP